jgi:hypothetical protein
MKHILQQTPSITTLPKNAIPKLNSSHVSNHSHAPAEITPPTGLLRPQRYAHAGVTPPPKSHITTATCCHINVKNNYSEST